MSRETHRIAGALTAQFDERMIGREEMPVVAGYFLPTVVVVVSRLCLRRFVCFLKRNSVQNGSFNGVKLSPRLRLFASSGWAFKARAHQHPTARIRAPSPTPQSRPHVFGERSVAEQRETQTTHAAADGHMNAASGRDVQTRPEAPRAADRERAMSAAGVIPRAVWTPRA